MCWNVIAMELRNAYQISKKWTLTKKKSCFLALVSTSALFTVLQWMLLVQWCYYKTSVRNLGVELDWSLTMVNHLNKKIGKTANFYIHNIDRIRRRLTYATVRTLPWRLSLLYQSTCLKKPKSTFFQTILHLHSFCICILCVWACRFTLINICNITY